MGLNYWTSRDGSLSLAGIKYWRSDWTISVLYAPGDGVFNSITSTTYICLLENTADADNKPGEGASWQTYWDVLAGPATGGGVVKLADVTGSINGINTVYTLSLTPVANSKVVILCNGFSYSEGKEFTRAGTTCTFITPLPSDIQTEITAGRGSIQALVQV